MRLVRILCFTAVTMMAWGADPFLGTWKLNTELSKYNSGPAPRVLTLTWTAETDGVRVKSDGLSSERRPIRESYLAIYDGKERTKPGPWNFDAVINRQNSELEREDIFKRGGTMIGTTRLVVSPDGKKLTCTWNFGENQDVRVFDRQ